MDGPRIPTHRVVPAAAGGEGDGQVVLPEPLGEMSAHGPRPARDVTVVGPEDDPRPRVLIQDPGYVLGHGLIAAGIVSYADLALGAAVAPVLEAHLETSRNRFRGIRYALMRGPDSSLSAGGGGIMSDQNFRAGFACLQKYGLSFDAFLSYSQLMDLAELAGDFPETTIIVNHCGSPHNMGPSTGETEATLPAWKQGITALAACPNVFMKLGGLSRIAQGPEAASRPPTSAELAEVIAPYCLFCIEQFGVDRCLFESNFPVDKNSCSYNVLWNAFKRATADCSPQERTALFHDTAVKAYRLETAYEGTGI